MVPGGAGHVWFIGCVPTYRPGAFILAICIPGWRSLQTLTSSLADSGGDRQTPRYRSVSAAGRCGDLTQSEPRTHAHWMEARFSLLHQCGLCTAVYPMQRGIGSHIWRFSYSLVRLYSLHPYTYKLLVEYLAQIFHDLLFHFTLQVVSFVYFSYLNYSIMLDRWLFCHPHLGEHLGQN